MSKFSVDSTLVVIPARGGSKRIPNKNIKEIFGQPMIYWPLMEIQKIFNRDNVLVSTDSEMIKGFVERKGINVPFMRPENLSDDFTGTAAVVEHALKWYEANVKKVDFILTVYPTAVLLREEDICAAITLLSEDEDCDSVMSATNFAFPIQRAIKVTVENRIEMFYPKHLEARSQDLDESYHDAGQFYWGKAEAFKQEKPLFSKSATPYILPRHLVQDIDTQEDWKRAELMYKVIKLGTKLLES